MKKSNRAMGHARISRNFLDFDLEIALFFTFEFFSGFHNIVDDTGRAW